MRSHYKKNVTNIFSVYFNFLNLSFLAKRRRIMAFTDLIANDISFEFESKEELQKAILIPVMNGLIQKGNIKTYFVLIASKKFRLLDKRKVVSYSVSTLFDWYHKYQNMGDLAFTPKKRKDKGKTRVLSDKILAFILEIISNNPKLTSKQVFIKTCTKFPESFFSFSTIYRYIKNNDLLKSTKQNNQEMKAFEASHPNYMWQTDIMYGPYLYVTHNKKKQVYLFAIIDDYSRYIIAAQFFFTEELRPFLHILKNGILTKGLPRMLYVDNGKIYHSNRLARITAALHISLIHTKIHSPTSKGKIERFFRTVRMQFLNEYTDFTGITLEQLNKDFQLWLNGSYHTAVHSTTKKTPHDRFFTSSYPIHLPQNPDKVELIFWEEKERRVRTDSTISLYSVIYEVPQHLKNKKVRIRFDPEKLQLPDYKFQVFDGPDFAGYATRLNRQNNFEKKRQTIDYSNIL